MKPALMILDMQKAYYEGAEKEAMDGAAAYVNAVLPAFRKAGLPVFWVYHRSPGVAEGDPGFEFIDALARRDGEAAIVKEKGSAFMAPGALELVRDSGMDMLVISGFCAEYCVLSTFKHAKDLDLNPVLLSGALASGSKENARFVHDICDHISWRPLVWAADGLAR